MASAVVQGASRGLGLQFCHHLLKSAPSSTQIFATCHNPDSAADLHQLQASYPDRFHVVQLDVAQEDQIKMASEAVKEKSGGSVDLLVNCAAMLHLSGRGETSLKDVSGVVGITRNLGYQHYWTTVDGQILLLHFWPKVRGHSVSPLRMQRSSILECWSICLQELALLLTMCSAVGTATACPKAPSTLQRNLSLELGRGRTTIICVCLHPGTVNTDLSRPYHRNVPADQLFSTEYSVSSLMSIVNGLSMDDTGKYMAWDGKAISF